MGIASGKHLLIAGGGYADIPMILAAKRLGFYVTTSGNRADDLGHAHADATRLADFSDPDEMLALAKELRIDAICASCNDFSALSCAYVAEHMGLPGHDPHATALTLHHKDRYRAFAQENGIPTPRAVRLARGEHTSTVVEHLRFPVLVKPVDLTGGKGISQVHVQASLDEAVENAMAISRLDHVIVEEFVEGSRHGFSCLIQDRKVSFHFNDDEHYYLNPYLVCAASSPGSTPEAAPVLIEQIERIAQRLDLVDGIVHLQYIMGASGPIIIEICRRPPGDLYPKLVKIATGIDYPEMIVRAAAGLDLPVAMETKATGHHLRYCLMADAPGTVAGIETERLAPHLLELFTLKQPGDVVRNHLIEKIGIAFLSYDSRPALLDAQRAMPACIRMTTGSSFHLPSHC